jgi:hypothetical protein
MNNNKPHISIFILLITMLSPGCAYHAPYPAHWPTLTASQNDTCPTIAGQYHNAGERWVGEGGSAQYQPPFLAGYFFADQPKAFRATTVIISQDSTGQLTIEARDNKLIDMTTDLRLDKDYTCRQGWVAIKRSRSVAENVSGYEKTVYLLKKAMDDSLIVQIQSTGVGLVFVVPVAGSSTEWHRFLPAKPDVSGGD